MIPYTSKSGPVIIIQDDPDDREVLKEVFQKLGIANELLFFSTAKEALYFLMDSSQKPVLILSDVKLPGMSGLELRRRINECDQLRKKSIPFIFMSTSNRQSDVDEAYNLDVQGYFEKPDLINELESTIRKIMDYWLSCRHPEVVRPNSLTSL